MVNNTDLLVNFLKMLHRKQFKKYILNLVSKLGFLFRERRGTN